MSAQTLQTAVANSLPRPINPAAVRQISAQSMSEAIQRAIIFTSGSCKHEAAQWSQAVAQL
tara:strand:- start:125585 stop:125767 length:183 start_codon:yes stop_codon:yes gene_type:complete